MRASTAGAIPGPFVWAISGNSSSHFSIKLRITLTFRVDLAAGGLEPAGEGEEEGDPLDRAVERTQQSSRDLASMM